MINWFLQFAAVIIAAGGIVYATHLIGKRAILPMFKVVVVFFRAVGALPVLLDIASEFKPNNRGTLRDQVDTQNLRLGNIEGQMEQLVQHLMIWNGEERRINDI